ncbi:MAG TPA: hypothetical protein VFT70_02640 [Nocardioides sp.]|nr:hypothetical protein [Nocardioides sp.]
MIAGAAGTSTIVALAGCDDADTVRSVDAPSSEVASPTLTPTPTPTSPPSSTPSPIESEASTPAPTPTESQASTSTPTSAPASAAPSSPPQEPELIPYAGGESAGVQVHGMADARKLRGSPKAFQDFIGRTAQRISDESSCDAAAVGVTVEFVRTDGYAVGGVNDCGGYAALWAVVDGAWKEIQGTQDSWKCQVLRRYRVPSDIAGETCYDYRTQEEHSYHQA